MLRRIVFVIAIASIGMLGAQVSADSLDQMLMRAKNFYNRGEYEYAIVELENALQYLKQLEQVDQVEAYKYLAFSYVAFGQQDKAKEQFRKVLMLDPAHELDPTTVSPKIIKVFEEVKAEMAAVMPEEPVVTEPAEPERVEPRPVPSSGFPYCCVPGWGQMRRGQGSKGMRFMVAGGTTLLASLVALGIRDARHQEYLDIETHDPDELSEAYDAYKTWHNISAISMTAFLAVYAYNIYDILTSKPTGTSSVTNFDQGLCCEVREDGVSIGYKTSF
jgi:tetratricopeptide (TPR) repeat protein